MEEKQKQSMDEAMRAIDESSRIRPKKSRRTLVIIVSVVLVLIAAGLIWRLFIYQPPQATPEAVQPQATVSEEPEQEPEPEPEFDKTAISKALKQWSASTGGTYGVTITDESGAVLAETGSTEQFFTASIYKLYVAYIGYQKIDDGTYSLSDLYLSGWTRGKCLDEMIRTSHSPCAEKMWAELGKESLTAKLKTYGLKNTSMTGLVTSSGDAAIILSRLQQGKDLSNASRKAMLASMLGQIYRDALPKGFAGSDVYDKVGFRGTNEYHDTAIVKLKDGRIMIVSVLTSNVGTKNIVALAKRLETAAN